MAIVYGNRLREIFASLAPRQAGAGCAEHSLDLFRADQMPGAAG
jgi:hypothetical protein